MEPSIPRIPPEQTPERDAQAKEEVKALKEQREFDATEGGRSISAARFSALCLQEALGTLLL